MPPGLRVLILLLTVVDDFLSLGVIAFAYSDPITVPALVVAIPCRRLHLPWRYISHVAECGYERLADQPVLAYDAPGCGASTCDNVSAVSIPFLVSVAQQVLQARHIDRLHLVGNSMGGLTALLLADAAPGRIASFTNIEGNVAPEDCFLNRQILTHSHDDPDEFLARFAERVGG